MRCDVHRPPPPFSIQLLVYSQAHRNVKRMNGLSTRIHGFPSKNNLFILRVINNVTFHRVV
jgi:hypothetical protein